MKRLWMFVALAMFAGAASIPETGWAQEFEVKQLELVSAQWIWPDSLKGLQDNAKDMAVGPDGYAYVATDCKHLFIRKPDGSWMQAGREQGLYAPFGTIFSVAVTKVGSVLAVTHDGIFRSFDHGGSWERVLADSIFTAEDILVTHDGTIFAFGWGIFRSTDNGTTWVQVVSDTITHGYSAGGSTETASGTILAGVGTGASYSGGGILRSTDGGDSWSFSNSDGITDRDIVFCLAAYPGLQTVFAVTYDRGTFRSDNDGVSWYPVTSLTEKYGRAVLADPLLGIFAGFSGSTKRDMLFCSTDGGVVWTPVPELKGFFILSFALLDEKHLLVGTHDGVWLLTFDVIATGVKEIPGAIPMEFTLCQNYPNPFNPTTTIEFSLPQRANVNLTVYNVLGQRIETLVTGELNPGSHQIVWNGSHYPSGIYFYCLQAGDFKETKKMLLVK